VLQLKSEAKYIVVGLGELLWDILPTGQQLGGAPANFAFMAAVLGDCGIIAARVGDDSLGREALHRLEQTGLDISHAQLDAAHSTGTVRIELDDKGRPTYTITEDIAWDYLEFTPDWQELAGRADAVCFGSLAQRSPESHATIRNFLKATRDETVIIFDANLRWPFYSPEVLAESLALSNIAKLNDEELARIVELLDVVGEGEEDSALRLLRLFDLQMVCVTRGERGSLLVTDAGSAEHPGFKTAVADTVGAGDSFSAALVHHYLRGESLERINEAANRLAATVVTQVGAMPEIAQLSMRSS
jgi:fructokinase